MNTSSRIAGEVEYFAERSQAESDERALAHWEKEQRIEREVTFSDLLEELCELDESKRDDFMALIACGSNTALHWIHVMLSDAKERIVKRRMAHGE